MAMSVSRRPFRARRGPGRHLGFRRSGSTLGYNPAAASRLPSPNERGSVRFLPRAQALTSRARSGSQRGPAAGPLLTAGPRSGGANLCGCCLWGPRPDGHGSVV